MYVQRSTFFYGQPMVLLLYQVVPYSCVPQKILTIGYEIYVVADSKSDATPTAES